MKKIFLLLLICLSAASADDSKTAVVRFVNKKVQVQREGVPVILKMGDKISFNEKVSIEENGKLEIEYEGRTFVTKKGGTVSEIISGSLSDGGFKESSVTSTVGVRALDGKRKSNKRESEEGGVLDRTVSVFSE